MSILHPGQQLGPYQIIQQIGKGGMATVYKAYHASMDRYVALKVVAIQLAEDPGFLQRFRQEARLIARLEHPHILPVHDFGEADGIPYMVMRFLEAGTLRERMNAGPLSLFEIDRAFSQLADALQYSHDKGVIHRDIKPSNAMLDKRGDIFLTDFGVAKMVEGAAQVTATGAITGTPAYMSPEQAQGAKVDNRSDIYSLGVVLYEMLTGKVPFEAETPMAVIFKHIQEPPVPLSIIRADLPFAMEVVLLRALAKDPNERYASMDEFLTNWKNAISQADASAFEPPAGYVQRPISQPGITPPPLTSLPPVTPPPSYSGTVTPPPTTPPTTPPISQTQPPIQQPSSGGIGGIFRALFTNFFVGMGVLFTVCLLCMGCFVAFAMMLPDTGQAGSTTTPEKTALPESTPQMPSTNSASETTSWAASNTYTQLRLTEEEIIAIGPGGVTLFDRNDPTKYSQITTADGLPSADVISDVLIDPNDGSLWVATGAGLYHETDAGYKIYTTQDGLDSDFVTSIAIVDEKIWVSTQGSTDEHAGLMVLNQNKFEPVTPAFPSSITEGPETVSNMVERIYPTTTGIWVTTHKGLALLDGENEWNVFTSQSEPTLTSDFVTVLYQEDTEDGKIWLGTEKSDLLTFDEDAWNFENITNLTEHGQYTIRAIQADSENNLWVAGDAGLARYDIGSEEWKYWQNDDESLPTNSIQSMQIGPDDTLYLGTQMDGLYLYKEKFSQYLPENKPRFAQYGKILLDPNDGSIIFNQLWSNGADVYQPANQAWQTADEKYQSPLAFDLNKRMWSGGNNGLWIFENGTDRQISTKDGLPSTIVQDIAFSQQDNLAYVATNAGIAVVTADGKVKEVYNKATAGFESEDIYHVFVAEDNTLWSLEYSVISYLGKSGKWEHIKADKLFNGYPDQLTGIVQDKNGVIWITTNGDGLYSYSKDGKWDRTLPDDSDLPSSYLAGISLAPDGSLWIGTYKNGVVNYDGKNWRVFTVESGLINPNVNGILVEENGNVWLATDGGITLLVP